MELNYSVKEQIDQHNIEVRFHGLTGREVVLVNGEEKVNRLNWKTKSEYLVELDAKKHIRIRTQVSLKGVLQVDFIRGGNVLASHTSNLYQGVAANDVLQQKENKAWLHEFQLPSIAVMLAFLAVLTSMQLVPVELLNVPAKFIVLTLLTLTAVWLVFNLPTHNNKDAVHHRLWSGILRFIGPGLMLGFAIGITVGYSISSLVAAMHNIIDKLF